MKTLIAIAAFLFLLIIGLSCNSTTKTCEEKEQAKAASPGLKDYYQAYFPMGVAVSPRSLSGKEADLIKKHFTSMTAENVMKMGPIHPEENKYNWGPADEIVNFSKQDNLMLRGHVLCWHNQTPDWIFVDKEGNNVSKEILLKRLESHITEVVTRYKGSIYSWDVVNEAISDKEGEFYRDSKWYQICEEEYIAKAFEYARAADPDAQLFYNDYSVINPVKRQKIYDLVKKLQGKGVPIDGIGIQGHWSVFEPSEQVLNETIEKFEDLGLQIQITELDVSIYEKGHSRRDRRPEDDDTFTDELKQMQTDQYDMIFRVFRENKDNLDGVTFWNVSDRRSWLDNFPVRGRKDYPLLFDQQLKPKEAYWKVTNFEK